MRLWRSSRDPSMASTTSTFQTSSSHLSSNGSPRPTNTRSVVTETLLTLHALASLDLSCRVGQQNSVTQNRSSSLCALAILSLFCALPLNATCRWFARFRSSLLITSRSAHTSSRSTFRGALVETKGIHASGTRMRLSGFTQVCSLCCCRSKRSRWFGTRSHHHSARNSQKSCAHRCPERRRCSISESTRYVPFCSSPAFPHPLSAPISPRVMLP